MSDEILLNHDHPSITVLTLNRPDQRNALSLALIQQLHEAIAAAVQSRRRVLVLRGAGTAFSAGMDLKEASDLASAERSAEFLLALFEALAAAPLVTIGAIHGPTMAGGAALAACCDLLIAADDLRFGFPETQRGLVPALAACLLRRKVNDAALRELLLTGRMVSANRARELGIVSAVVSSTHLDDAAAALAHDVLRGAPQAVEQTKRLLEQLQRRPLHDALRQALDSHVAGRRSEEAQEGITAFIEKRPPRWQAP